MKKGFLFGLGLLVTSVVFATVTVNISDKAEGEGLIASEFNQIVDVLEGVQALSGNIGIGTEPDTDVKLDINGSMKLVPQATGGTCNSGLEGVIYIDTDNHWYGCNGTGWIQLDNE
jgi:hypothetical protein